MKRNNLLGKFFICESPKNGKYVKAINTIREYEDKRRFHMNEIVVADKKINLNAVEIEEMGGLNVSNYESVLRWLLRGDTLCDVTIPEDGHIYETVSFSTNHGAFRADKIILSNPRVIDDNLALELYKVSKLPWKSYMESLVYLTTQGFSKTCNIIVEEKINKKNVKKALEIYKNYFKMGDSPPELYVEILKKIENIKGKRKYNFFNKNKL